MRFKAMLTAGLLSTARRGRGWIQLGKAGILQRVTRCGHDGRPGKVTQQRRYVSMTNNFHRLILRHPISISLETASECNQIRPALIRVAPVPMNSLAQLQPIMQS